VSNYVYDRGGVIEDSAQTNNEVCKLVSVFGSGSNMTNEHE